MTHRQRIFAIGVALVVIAAVSGWVAFRLGGMRGTRRPLPVPPGDCEIAWFHTATNLNTWERFVAGMHYAARSLPDLDVDDSQAFPEMTAGVPEVVLSWHGIREKLRIRWYKQSSQAGIADWVHSLAQRNPPPLAIIGGGSSDRAMELAQALARQSEWRGAPPLLLMTTATADKLQSAEETFRELDLIRVYDGRSFRFCFTNRQMARAVVDFVWNHRELRPRRPLWSIGATLAVLSPWDALLPCISARNDPFPAEVFRVQWNDDPYSVDLANQFGYVLMMPPADEDGIDRPWVGELMARARLDIASSIGGYLRPNPDEDSTARRLAAGDAFHIPIPREPFQRSLLVLPVSPHPARRLLTALNAASPEIGRHLVALTGDSINLNHVYRDGPLMWNVRIVPIPLVFFAHQNPVAWDPPPQSDTALAVRLDPPNSTDEVLHFADMVRILCRTIFPQSRSAGANSPIVSRADDLAARLRSLDPPYFDDLGNRRVGTGEFVIYLRPRRPDDPARPLATLEVWTHQADGWHPVRPPLELHDH
jgi:hypothetical protein